ncbi:uncharacterized protein [Antedon mediterranea]|uniref:uncharacterized protein n=1 Tax=Antedon mediterranea TaxID=105859 RepID=UPI003AF7E2E4
MACTNKFHFSMVIWHLMFLVFFSAFHPSLTCRVNTHTCPDNIQEVTSKNPHGDCQGFRFPCVNSSQCVPGNFICNGNRDCDNGSDELPEECATNNPLYTNVWNHIYGTERRGGDGDSSDEDYNPDNFCENGTYPSGCLCFLRCQSRHGSTADDGDCESEVYCNNMLGFTTIPRDLPLNTVLLDLSDNDITHVTREDLDHLPNLRVLYFPRNRKLRFEPDALQYRSLLELNLIGCQMGEIPDGLFKGMSNLSYLHLQYNELKTINRDTFMGLDNLYELNLNYNEISEFDPTAFNHTPYLQKLNVQYNRLKVLLPPLLKPLTDLQVLGMSFNEISDIKTGFFDSQTHLEDLLLMGNKLTVIKVGMFQNLYGLRSMTLRENKIHEIEAHSFDHVESLRSLFLAKNPFESLPDHVFCAMTNNLDTVEFDSFSFCGFAPHARHCYPKTDGLSSVEHMLKNVILRISVWIVGSVALFGNIFVLTTRLFVNETKRVHAFLIMNLAMADLLMGVYLYIVAIHGALFSDEYILHDLVWRSSEICTIAGCLSILSSLMSVFTLSVITLDRYVSIVHPFSYERKSLLRAAILMAALWLFSISLVVLPVILKASFGGLFYGSNGVCLPLQIRHPWASGWVFTTTLFVGINTVFFMFVVYAYIAMFIMIRRADDVRSTKKSQDSAILVRFTLLVFTDMLCWLPICVIKILAIAGHPVSGDVYSWLAVFVLPINAALNPMLYTITSKLFRQQLRIILHKCRRYTGYRRGRRDDDSDSFKRSGTRLSLIPIRSKASLKSKSSIDKSKQNT